MVVAARAEPAGVLCHGLELGFESRDWELGFGRWEASGVGTMSGSLENNGSSFKKTTFVQVDRVDPRLITSLVADEWAQRNLARMHLLSTATAKPA